MLSHSEEWDPKGVKPFATDEPPANGRATKGRDKKRIHSSCSFLSKRRLERGFLARPCGQAGSPALQSGQQPKSKGKPKNAPTKTSKFCGDGGTVMANSRMNPATLRC